jgi:hypothetical protein
MLRYIIAWEFLGVLAFAAEMTDSWLRANGHYGPKVAARQNALIDDQGGLVLAQLWTLLACLVLPPLALVMTALTIRASRTVMRREEDSHDG